MGPGKFIAGIFICGMLVSLPSMINAGGTQMGFRADSFAPIAYVQPGSFGAAAVPSMPFSHWQNWPASVLS